MKKLLYRVDGGVCFCPGDRCPHYDSATKYPRKCYYEPQCWGGYLDVVLSLTKTRIRRRGNKGGL